MILYKMSVIDITQPTILCEIMGNNRSDKGNKNIIYSHHNYTVLYHHIFENFRFKKMRIFELGLGTNDISMPSNMGINGRPGASHYGWSEYFPNSEIFGADIDKKVLFQTDRIKTFYCDQTNPDAIKELWNKKLLEENFDIIVEDGLHKFEANVCFFENSIHKLKNNGYYIIEDIIIDEQNLFIEKIKEWEVKYPECNFSLIIIPSYVNKYDNTLLIIYKS